MLNQFVPVWYYSASFCKGLLVGCGQVGSVHCEPLQLVALNTKGLVAQPLPQPEESVCKQQALGGLMCHASCLLLHLLLVSGCSDVAPTLLVCTALRKQTCIRD